MTDSLYLPNFSYSIQQFSGLTAIITLKNTQSPSSITSSNIEFKHIQLDSMDQLRNIVTSTDDNSL